MDTDILEQIKQKIQKLEIMLEEMCKSCREDKEQRAAAAKIVKALAKELKNPDKTIKS